MDSTLRPKPSPSQLRSIIAEFALQMMERHKDLGKLTEAYIRSSCAIGILCIKPNTFPSEAEPLFFGQDHLKAITSYADDYHGLPVDSPDRPKAEDLALQSAQELWDYAVKTLSSGAIPMSPLEISDIVAIQAFVQGMCIDECNPATWFPPKDVKRAADEYWPLKPMTYVTTRFEKQFVGFSIPNYHVRLDHRVLTDSITSRIPDRRSLDDDPSTYGHWLKVFPDAPPPPEHLTPLALPISWEGSDSLDSAYLVNSAPPQSGPSDSDDVGAPADFALPLSRPGLDGDVD